ncbi:MAG TPA: phage tail tip lysozyme [Polyangiaceae bacterium]|jgi:hypothetical protein
MGWSTERRAVVRTHLAWTLAAGTLLVAGCSSPGGEATGANGAASTAFPNDQPAYDYFVGKGLTNFQAAGIVGNLDQESGVDPNAVQAGGPGRGIAQWSAGGRWDTDSGDNLVAFAAGEGLPTSSLQVQLDFIWFELQSFPSYGLAKLRATTTITDATVAFETDFEGCGSCDETARINYAEDVLKAYGADPVPVDAGGASDAGPTHDAGAAHDAGSGGGAKDAGLADASSGMTTDAATPEPPGTGDTGDAGAPATPITALTGGSGGCAIARDREGAGDWSWLLALGLVVFRRARRQAMVRITD